MALTDAEVQLIEEGISLSISAVLAAVKASHSGTIDWNSVRIADTPEAALQKARQAQAASTSGTGQKTTA